jgi:hypothetical protein
MLYTTPIYLPKCTKQYYLTGTPPLPKFRSGGIRTYAICVIFVIGAQSKEIALQKAPDSLTTRLSTPYLLGFDQFTLLGDRPNSR